MVKNFCHFNCKNEIKKAWGSSLVRAEEHGVGEHVDEALEGVLCQGVVAVAHVVLPDNVGQGKFLLRVLGPVLESINSICIYVYVATCKS